MKNVLLLTGLCAILTLTGCADVTTVPPEVLLTGHTYGFWGGLWHGLTLPFSFFGQLFSDEIAMFAVNNDGGWYNFGFWTGAVLFGGSSGVVSTSSKGK